MISFLQGFLKAAEEFGARPMTKTSEGILDKLKQWEGWRSKAYNDSKKIPTIGYGHAFQPNDGQLFTNLFGAKIDYPKLLSGQKELSSLQGEQLLSHDFNQASNRAVRAVPSLPSLPEDVRGALINSLYRGEKSPKTWGLMNKGDWTGASKEYLNNAEYRTNLGGRGPSPGIVPRMQYNANVFSNYGRSISNKPVQVKPQAQIPKMPLKPVSQ